jgi:hypothetical protein
LFAWQLSALSTAAVALSTSAPIALLQPKRQPPAIQIDTTAERSNRATLFEKNKLILKWRIRLRMSFVEFLIRLSSALSIRVHLRLVSKS